MSKARSRQNRSRSSPLSMRHWCSICEGWLTKHPLHSIVMASLTTSLTAKTIARTNCTCICVMVKWGCSLSAAAYIESLRRFQNVCRFGLNFIYGYWGKPNDSSLHYAGVNLSLWEMSHPQTFAKRISSMNCTILLLYCAMSQLDPSFYIWIHFIVKTIEIRF